MNDFRELYDIRDGIEEDNNFILATFLRGLYYGDSWFSNIPKNIFMENYEIIAKAILASKGTTIKVACLPEDPSVILGYSILSADYRTIKWVFVKRAWRNKGIGKSLVPQHPAYVSHLTALGKTLLSKLPNTTFNPFSI